MPSESQALDGVVAFCQGTTIYTTYDAVINNVVTKLPAAVDFKWFTAAALTSNDIHRGMLKGCL